MSISTLRRMFGIAVPALAVIGTILGASIAPGAPPPDNEVLFQVFDVDEDGAPDAVASFEATAHKAALHGDAFELFLAPDDAAAFEQYTAARVGDTLALRVDGVTEALPVVREPIGSGRLIVHRG
jgi:hypothetical protein